MRHPSLYKWEKKLDEIFDGIDSYLEEKYGKLHSLHPVRARRKPTGNPEYDGLFQLGAVFTAGFGSDLGAGYIVKIEMVTLDKVDPEMRKSIEDDVAKMLRESLPKAFPGRDLRVRRDKGGIYKIYGDLSLGKV